MDKMTKDYLIPNSISNHQRIQYEKMLQPIIKKLGPEIKNYPLWHPIIKTKKRKLFTTTSM